MCTAIDVQDFASDLAGFGQVEDSLRDVLGAAICPSGDSVRRKSFGLFSWSGVSTTPGATTFTRIPCVEYSIARLREIASMPPLVIMGTDAVNTASGLSTMDEVMLTTLPPDFCESICLTASCVV